MPKLMEFDPKDTHHKGDLPKTRVESRDRDEKKYLHHTPEERKGHSYKRREVLSDGTTIYYYGDGVKAIHHPDKEVATTDYHNKAKDHHETQSRMALKSGQLRTAKAHGRAASGHDFAITAKGGTPSVKELSKFVKKEAAGTFAVASDPGVFTPTYSGRGTGHSKKKKKPKTGPEKLNTFLNKPKKQEQGVVKEFTIQLIKDVSTSLVDKDSQGRMKSKTFTGEAHYGDVSGYIPPAESTEDQKNNTAYRGGTETDVKKSLNLFDLITNSEEDDDELMKMFSNFLDEVGIDVE